MLPYIPAIRSECGTQVAAPVLPSELRTNSSVSAAQCRLSHEVRMSTDFLLLSRGLRFSAVTFGVARRSGSDFAG